MTILAIETSCDDTSVAVVRDGSVLSNVITSQPIHDTYGGIVPELASREHVKAIGPITTIALAEAGCNMLDIDAIGVTYGPGLAGSLVVGLQFAKGLALAHSLPLIPVHHIEAHIYSAFLERTDIPLPSVGLVVSGGHTALVLVDDMWTYRYLGTTRDDAAGEAFDKVAKMLGLGYPGGPHIDKLAAAGNPLAIAFPRGLSGKKGFDMSFSGLKTAVRTYLANDGSASLEDVCASVQRAIVEVLVEKTVAAAHEYNVQSITVSGGVSANSELRRTMAERASELGLVCAFPALQYSVDNAAMIGFVAERMIRHAEYGVDSWLNATVQPNPIR